MSSSGVLPVGAVRDQSLGSVTGKKRKKSSGVAKQKKKINKRVCSDGQERVMRHLTMRKVYIHQIRNGIKTVEGRIFKAGICKYEVGDCIRFYYFTDSKDDVQCEITQIKCFASFKQMLTEVGFKSCIPEASTLEGAVQMYHSIPKYKERALEHGVAAIY
ncbi:hypothetical protein COB21_04490, partial [Candidatus Aerophobetes bacterium]